MFVGEYMTLRYSKKTSYRDSKGATLIMAIIIMTILIVFTFSLTLLAYTLYASQNKNISSLKCKEAANTLSVALEKDLTYEYVDKNNIKNNKFPETESYLYRYLRFNLCQDDKTWPYYVNDSVTNHDRTSAYRYFDLNFNTSKKIYDDEGHETGERVESIEGLPGKTSVCIYWKLPKGVDYTTVSQMKNKDKNDRQGIRLFVEVTCEAGNQSYTVKREYELKIENYDTTKSAEKNRLNGLMKSDVQSDLAVNPLGLKMSENPSEDELYYKEKWVWVPVSELSGED